MGNKQDLNIFDYIMYLSNAGVLVKIKDKKILIDAFCNSEIPIYKSTPSDMLERMVNCVEPFESIDIILITHHHSDHFDIRSISRFLSCNLNTIVVSTPEVISRLKQAEGNIENNRLIELNINQGSFETVRIKDVSIQVISMLHEGKEYEAIHNYAYLIDYKGKVILHLGDTSPEPKNFTKLNLKPYRIDLLIANFPFISVPTARNIIMNDISPNRVAVVHLPRIEMDRFGWIKTAKKNYESIKYDFAPTTFLEVIGDTIEL